MHRSNYKHLPPLLLATILASLFACGCKQAVKPTVDANVTDSPSHDTNSPLTFRDITSSAGFDAHLSSFQDQRSYSIVEFIVGGISLADFDHNGAVDIVAAGGGQIDIEARSMQGGEVLAYQGSASLRFTRFPEPMFRRSFDSYAAGTLAGDLNDDGFADLVITGYDAVTIYMNQGDGSFSATRFSQSLNFQCSCASAIGDLDDDGFQDIYISNYCDWTFDNDPECTGVGTMANVRDVCGPSAFKGARDAVLRGNGQGKFEVATNAMLPDTPGHGLGVLIADLTGNAALDVYVANDGEGNFLFENDGHGRFRDVGMIRGVALGPKGGRQGSMGIAIGDYDRNQKQDLIVTNLLAERTSLYAGRQQGGYTAKSSGVGLAEVPALAFSWGAALVDLDFDGDDDLPIVNGDVKYFPENGEIRQRPYLFENRDSKFFEVGAGSEFFNDVHYSKGLAVGDINGDLVPDLAVCNLDEPLAILENTCQQPGNGIVLELIGTESNRDPIGAKISVTAKEQVFVYQISSGGSFASSHEPCIFVGLGSAKTIDKIDVSWPSGQQTHLSNLDVNQRIAIIEGRKDPIVRLPR